MEEGQPARAMKNTGDTGTPEGGTWKVAETHPALRLLSHNAYPCGH